MQSLGVVARSPRIVVALGGIFVMSACGGGAPSTPAAIPPSNTQAMEPLPAEVQTSGQEATVGPSAFVFGVDLDTIQAGPFDQGKMWTFEAPPVSYFADTYGFRPDAAWFEKARLGALRIPSCSASFVSPNGLVMTNHHCAREFLTQVTREGESLLDNGFVATDLVDEREVEDFEADQLIEIIDVTEEVNSSLDALPAEQRGEARAALLSEIEARVLEQRGGEDAGYVVEMISLYNGGRTSAYIFRRYVNAKVVAAPELQIGFFGGDPDNFTYPRYNLDYAFFRIYGEDDRPLSTETYFAFDDDGLEDGDPIFIIGNPGSTSRLQTVAELEFRRDIGDRYVLDLLRTRMEVIDGFIQQYPDEAEELDLRNTYFSLSNSLKAISGQVSGLEDPVVIARRKDTESNFQAAIEASPDLSTRYGSLINRMAELQAQKREAGAGYGAFLGLGSPDLRSSTIYRAFLAFQVLSARQGGAPPEAIAPLVEDLVSVADQPSDLDRAMIEARLHDFERLFGISSPLMSGVLGGRTIEARARMLVDESVLQDSVSAVQAIESNTLTISDPALDLVRGFLPAFIEYQQMFGPVGPEEAEISAELGRARFEIYGTDVPPDATFSLRIADGLVMGYDYNGTRAPAFTTIYGMYDRHHSHAGDPDWFLPERWLDPPGTLDLTTPINFVSTADIIGGNSGSPVLDRDLEVVGVVFDGNIESLPGDYIYLPEFNRSVTVDSRAILESLDEIYDSDRLVVEITTGRLVETEQEADGAR